MTSRVQQDPAQTGSNRVLPAPDLWDMVVLGRHGQPPLRFKGQRLAHLRRAMTCGAVVFIDIWARKKGDFVLAYSDFCGSRLKPDARVIGSVSEAADYLEMLCLTPPKTKLQADLPMTLSGLLQRLGHQQQFSLLIGDFLAELETYSAHHSAHPTASER